MKPAPEQFQGAPASGETDLYAAGAILWEAATGRSLRSHADLLQRGRPSDPDASGQETEDGMRAQLRARIPDSAEIILALLHPAPSTRRQAWPLAPNKY